MKFSLLRLLVFTAVIAAWAGLSSAFYDSILLDDVSSPSLRAAFAIVLVPIAGALAMLVIGGSIDVTNTICSWIEKEDQ